MTFHLIDVHGSFFASGSAEHVLSQLRLRESGIHARAGGDLCADRNGDGCCDACGVLLGRDCPDCDGNGYHRAGCPSSEENDRDRT